MWTTTSLLVCVYSLGVFRVCADPDFLKASLLEKVNRTTEVNHTTEVNRTATDSYVRIKHQSVSISWLNKPPYIYDENGTRSGKKSQNLSKKTTNSSEEAQVKQENVKGIFYGIINKGLQLCDVISQGGAHFTTKAQDLQQLDQSIVNGKIDFAMPVHGSDDGKYGGYDYVEILKSPGVVFIVNREETKDHLRKQVTQAMKDTWPVIVLTFLLTGFAGLIIWGLDASCNPEQFPRSFKQGVMEGIWWSFVSMTTVGYGDRVPKSSFARFFGMLWILTGIVLCSFFTATFTSALTASSIKQRESLLGVKVAVIADTHAFEEAINHAANVKGCCYSGYPCLRGSHKSCCKCERLSRLLPNVRCTGGKERSGGDFSGYLHSLVLHGKNRRPSTGGLHDLEQSALHWFSDRT